MNILKKTNINSYIKESIERARFFQDVHAWPLTEEFNYEKWLDNFEGDEEKYIACHLLDFFNYYPDIMIDKMLASSVGAAGQIFSQKFKNWEHSHFRTRCYYSHIPGENPSQADSGHIFARKLRDKLGIPEDQIINFNQLFGLLESQPIPRPVILVDDFIGSGHQCTKAWNDIQPGNKISLQTLVTERHHICVYAPIIANVEGCKKINIESPSLRLSVAHILDSKYNLFSPDCICWHDDTELFHEGCELIIGKSQEIGIPDTEGRDVYDVRGYYQQGLAIAFAHGIPDAVPALFYSCDNDWKPLVKKRYER
ncbi:MAG: hypothetical protein KAS17_08940 [Victivallaceae bacterium]|nr:hypothetical protein [Victivallaceae bacterium]